ncbi:hypothetical protein HYV82_05335 [Candidatus Woesearchaeota archaeon]|nr:hypothetical protein [Candidatus Woesearchaeota archaeon]
MDSLIVAGPSGVAVRPDEQSIDLLVKEVNRRQLDFLVRYMVDHANVPNRNVPWIEVIAYVPHNAKERFLEKLGWLHASRQVRVYPRMAGMNSDGVRKLFESCYGHCILLFSEPYQGKIEVLD